MDSSPAKRKRGLDQNVDSDPLASYLLDLKCPICLLSFYHSLDMICPPNASCLKGGHVMCKRCNESYGSHACPICKSNSYSTWVPFLPAGLLEPLETSLDALVVQCRTCDQTFGGRSAYMDHFTCATCGIEKPCCTDKEHVCKDVVQAKLEEMETYYQNKLDKQKKDHEKQIMWKANTIRDLQELLDENEIEYEA